MRPLFRIFLALALLISARATTYDFATVTGLGTATRTLGSHTAVGVKLRNGAGADIVITQLARWVISGNSQMHTLSIVKNDGTVMGSLTINCSGAPTGQFLWGTLASPVTVPSGTIFYVVSSETSGGSNDQWYGAANTVITTSGVDSTLESAYWNGGSSFTDTGNSGGTKTTYGPVNFRYTSPSPNWTKNGNVYTTDGSQFSVRSAILDSSNGDIVDVPAGSFTWGSGSSAFGLNKQIWLRGAGSSQSLITIASDGPTGTAGVLRISAQVTVSGLTLSPAANGVTMFNTSTSNDWRITDVIYNSANTSGSAAYFLYATSYGLVDNCTINGAGGSEEWIYTRGPSNAWSVASTFGTANAVYLEDCTFSNMGYMDFNSNAYGVVRFCTFSPVGNYIKVDGHGQSTNTPAFSVRGLEVHNNTWVLYKGDRSIELRGGTGFVFNNGNTSATAAQFILNDYYYRTNETTNLGYYATAYNYPLPQQIGQGASGIEPMYIWGNTRNGGASVWPRTVQAIGVASAWLTNTAGYSIGATSITLASRTSAGSGSGKIGGGNGTTTGDAIAIAGDTANRYLVTSGLPSGATSGTITIAAPGLIQAIPASAVAVTSGPLQKYQQQTGNMSATFTETDVIQSNRDFYADAGFDSNTGVTVGSAATMAGTAATLNHGFWVTNEGSWNTTLPANTSGRLYVGDGVNWVLAYTPYTYPHPLRGTFPVPESATINSAGTTLTIVWSESCTNGAGGGNGVTISLSGGAATATYASGSGSATYVYNITGRTISSGESGTTSYTQPGDGIEATVGGAEVASFTGQSITNASTVNATQAPGLRNPAALGAGF